MRYAPNQTPDNVPGNSFFGSEFYRIQQAIRNIEADSLTVYQGSPAKKAFTVDPSGISIYDTVGTTPYAKFYNSSAVQNGLLNFTNSVATLEQLNSNSGRLDFFAKDAAGTRRGVQWEPAAGTIGGRFSLYGKDVIQSADGFLRLNQTGDFASGVMTPGKVRADAGFDIGNVVGTLRLGTGRGSINTVDAVGGWYGYQCNGRVAFLHDGTSAVALYDLVNSKTLFGATLAAESSMYHNNVQTAKTGVSDFQVFDGTAFRSVFKGQRFKSAQQTNATFGSVAHGLGLLPTFYQAVLVCVTAEKGYSIGDEVDLLSAEGSSGQFPAVWADATNVGWAMVQTNPFINTKGSATNSAITAANWKIVLKAWLWQ